MRRPPPAPDEICGRHNKEIRVRMGEFTKTLCSACDAPCGVLWTGCVGIKGVSLAPQVGFEPTTIRLTASGLIHKNKGFIFVLNSLLVTSTSPLYTALLP